MRHRSIMYSGLQGFLVLLVAGLFSSQSVLAANYYVGNDTACDFDRITMALFTAAFSADANPVFYISKDKPAENAEITLTYAALETAEFRGGYNSCQDARNGVTPSGRSSIHSNALSTGANRRNIRVGSTSTSPTVRFYDVTISGGRLDSGVVPDGFGAGIFVQYGVVHLFRTHVEGNWTNPANTSSRGGGVAVSGTGRLLTMDAGTMIRDNVAHDGGGIYCRTNAQVLMEGSYVRANRAVRGGGLHITNGCIAPLTSTATSSGRVRNNTAGEPGNRAGGGIYVGTNGFVSILGSSSRRFLLTGNASVFGGGAIVSGNNGYLAIDWADVDSNQGAGGGLWCSNTGSDVGLIAQNIRVRNNNAGASSGGGVLVGSGCSARLHNGVTISGNSAGAYGGGVYVTGHLTIEGGTQAARIVNNNAESGGGAAVFFSSSRLNLDNVEVSGNTATDWGGGLFARYEGAEITMRRTLVGSACHSEFYCSDLSFNILDAAIPDRGAAAAARDGGKIEIWGTYIEGNQGTAIRAVDLNSGNGGVINVGSSVMVPTSNRPMIRTDRARVQLLYNTIDHAGSSSVPITLFDGNSSDRRSFFYGNLFNGSAAPLTSGNANWFSIGTNGCSGFSQAHLGNDFFSAHAAARRFVGDLPLMSNTRLINDPTHPIIDFCDQDLAMNPEIDILGNSRPHTTANPNTHGPFDLGAHEARIPPLYTLTASRSGEGSLSSTPAGISCPGTCEAQFVENDIVQVTATPAAGWAFSHWDGNCSGTHATCNVTMSGNRVVVARFVQQFNLNVYLVGDGSVNIQPANITCSSNCTEVFNDGSVLELTASPDPGFQFNGWTGACTGTGTCNVTMSQNRSVTAEFVATPSSDVIFQNRFQN